VFCAVKAVHKFDSRLVINETPNTWRLVERRSCSDTHFLCGIRTFSPCHRREYYGTLPTLCRSNAFSWVTEFIQGVSRLVDITAGGDFLGLCGQKSSYKHVSDFRRLRSYDRLKLRTQGNDYW